MRTWTFDNVCDEDWNQMEVQKGGRHCERCEHLVIDLSVMTEREFNRLAKKRGSENMCGRAKVSPDGTPIFRREPRKRLAGGFALMTALSVVSCTPEVVTAPIAVELTVAAPLAKLAVPSRPALSRPALSRSLRVRPRTRQGTTDGSPSSSRPTSVAADDPSDRPVADCATPVTQHARMGGLRLL